MPVELEGLQNIGPGIAKKLRRAGIRTPAALKRAGAKKAFELIRKKEPEACVCCRYCLEGALKGRPWPEMKG